MTRPGRPTSPAFSASSAPCPARPPPPPPAPGDPDARAGAPAPPGFRGGPGSVPGPLVMSAQTSGTATRRAGRAWGEYAPPLPRPSSDEILLVPANIDAFAED